MTNLKISDRAIAAVEYRSCRRGVKLTRSEIIAQAQEYEKLHSPPKLRRGATEKEFMESLEALPPAIRKALEEAYK